MLEKLILGTVQLGLPYGINNKNGKPSPAEAQALLATAYNRGIRYLDTAEAYGDSQQVIGSYHRLAGFAKFSVITKYKGGEDFPSEALFRDYILRNLEILNVDSLHAYLFHNFAIYQNFTFWNVLEQLVREGRIQCVGVSVYTNEQARHVALDDRISIVQLPFNLLDNFSLRGFTLEMLKSKGKQIHARSAFLQGLFYKNRRELGRLEPLRKNLEQLDAIAQSEALSIGALALGYCLRQPFVDKILIGVENEKQLIENIRMAAMANNINTQLFERIDTIQVAAPELLNPSNWS